MNYDGTYIINVMLDMPYADRYANRHVNQLHFMQTRKRTDVLQWVGEHVDTTCWHTPINPVQAKKAVLLLLLED